VPKPLGVLLWYSSRLLLLLKVLLDDGRVVGPMEDGLIDALEEVKE
jgi:hypothetical protein